MAATTEQSSTRAPALEGEVPLALIRPSAANPRKRFDEEALRELADSIRAVGILEPLVVRQTRRLKPPVAGGVPGAMAGVPLQPAYEIVAGERRFRAAQLAGLSTVPVRILDVDEPTARKLRLIENLQRQDLDPAEEAEGYRQLHDVLGLRQAEIAAAVHRSQPSVANAMRILDLPDDVVERIRAGELTRGHGIALARYKAFPRVASYLGARAAREHWTVATTEDAINQWQVYSELERRALARSLTDYDTLFDTAVCNACPFGAHFGHHCLKPEHYDELDAAARAGRERAVARLTEQAKAEGKELPKAEELAGRGFERLWDAPPDGCTEACPCRGAALDHRGEVVAICSDPARHARLAEAADARRKAAGRERHRAALAALEAAIDGQREIGSRELAILAALALERLGSSKAIKAAQRHAPGLRDVAKVSPSERRLLVGELAKLTPEALAKLAVEAVLREELAWHLEGHGGASPLAHWYAGLGAPREERP